MSVEEPVPDGTEATDPVVIELLDKARAMPAPLFRGALARRLADENPGWGPRPDHLWPRALALVIVGAVLLLLGALISVGGI